MRVVPYSSMLGSFCLAVVGALVIVPACSASLSASGAEGEGEGEREAAGAGESICDAGCSDAAADACARVVARSCGACEGSAGCEAATLLARYEPDRCEGALADERRFPPCAVTTCAALMERVCGGTTPSQACAANPGCAPGQVLYERATASDSTADEVARAESSCARALTDAALFAPCEP